MNHLAHLFLAGDTPESLLGNLAGDFVKGRLNGRFTPGIRAGILEHRRIDAFTDAHAEVGAFRRIIAREHGHYARVIADMFFDHFLANEWDAYSREPLTMFLEHVFRTLDARVEDMPEPLRRIYPRIRDEGWLLSYRQLDGIQSALFYMSRRFSRPVRLETAAHLLRDARPELLAHFRTAFPDIMAYASNLR
jgi:acyl carrier protein phosphodiesterase